MVKIPNDVVQKVQSETNIVDVVSSYIQLKKAGNNWFGLCPFHEEKTPSFSVSEDKQIFHCFSCGRGGNVFTFIMEIENCNFPEAVQKVAEIENIDISNDVHQTDNPKDTKRESFYKLYEEAQEFYAHILTKTENGEEALEYLHHRGMNDELIETFGIGYIPNQLDLLLKLFKEKDLSADTLRESGLFTNDDQGNFYDRFQGRIMYPIKDSNGRVIAFSGRVFGENKQQAKYLNSPDTILFDKSNTLFNYDLAKKEARKTGKIVLYEGFMDVISAYGAEVKNGVASMGTSLTTQQIYLLKRITDEIVINYDGDDAGQSATHRALNLLNNQKLELGVVVLPDNQDPDEFIQTHGAEQYREVLNTQVKTPIEFEIQYLKKNYNLNNDHDKMEFLNKAIELLSQVNSAIELDIFTKKLSDDLDVSKKSIEQQLNDVRRENAIKNPPKDYNPQKVLKEAASLSTESNKVSNKLDKAEQNLLYLTLRFSAVYQKVLDTKNFAFVHEQYNRIFGLWGDKATEDTTISEFMNYLSSDLQNVIVNIEVENHPDSYTDEEVDDYIQVIQDYSIVQDLEKVTRDFDKAVETGDKNLQLKLVQKKIELRNKLQDNENR